MTLPDGLLLADTSAWERAGDARVRGEWSHAITDGRIVTCLPVRFELLYSTRNADEFELLESRLAALRDITITMSIQRAAMAGLRSLARLGPLHHRVPLPSSSATYVSSCRLSSRTSLGHVESVGLTAPKLGSGRPMRAVDRRGKLRAATSNHLEATMSDLNEQFDDGDVPEDLEVSPEHSAEVAGGTDAIDPDLAHRMATLPKVPMTVGTPVPNPPAPPEGAGSGSMTG